MIVSLVVVNACKKLLFRELKVFPTLNAGDHKRLTSVLQKRRYAIKVVSKPLCSGERQSTAQDTDKDNHPGNRTQGTDKENDWSVDERMLGKLPDCSLYLINLFPEFQTPYLPVCPLIKRLA